MNKQRLTKITRTAKQASDTGGVLDFSIPEALLRQRLATDPKKYDVDAILQELSHRVAWARLEASVPRMKPSEVSKQAKDTAAVIDELIVRINHIYPELESFVDEALYQARGEFVLDMRGRIEPDLYRLRGVMLSVAKTIDANPGQTGPKSAWPIMRDAIANTLRDHSEPQLDSRGAKALAAELLELCEMPSPRRR